MARRQGADRAALGVLQSRRMVVVRGKPSFYARRAQRYDWVDEGRGTKMDSPSYLALQESLRRRFHNFYDGGCNTMYKVYTALMQGSGVVFSR